MAFAILALMMGPVLQAFSGGTTATARTSGLTKATALARSRIDGLAEFGPLQAGVRSGEFPNSGYRWHVTIAPFDGRGAGGTEALYRVEARVFWSENGRERVVSLATVRLGEP